MTAFLAIICLAPLLVGERWRADPKVRRRESWSLSTGFLSPIPIASSPRRYRRSLPLSHRPLIARRHAFVTQYLPVLGIPCRMCNSRGIGPWNRCWSIRHLSPPRTGWKPRRRGNCRRSPRISMQRGRYRIQSTSTCSRENMLQSTLASFRWGYFFFSDTSTTEI